MAKIKIMFMIWVINSVLILMAQVPQSQLSENIVGLARTGCWLVERLEEESNKID